MASSSEPPLSLTWSIDTTLNKTLSFSTGLIRACTSDNVQPLALLSCERFGAQLAICPETRLKVEQLARRKHTSYFFKHLEMSIGFASGDAADYLASSDAGVRFLGLAAALFSFDSNFQAAVTLHALLDRFSPNDQLLPTIGHLKELLKALEPKLKCSGFADMLLGWSILIFSPGSVIGNVCLSEPQFAEVAEYCARFDGAPYPEKGNVVSDSRYFPCNKCPSIEDMGNMIKAMSEVQRIGQAGHAVFTIPADFAVWVIGLVKWCMGKPPSVMRKLSTPSSQHGSQKEGLYQQDAQISIRMDDLGSKSVHVQVFKALDSLDDLLWDHLSHVNKTSPWMGMVSPKLYVYNRVLELQRFYNLKHVTQFMITLAKEIGDRVVGNGTDLAEYHRRPFPSSAQLVTLFRRLLPSEDQDGIEDYATNQPLRLWAGVPRRVIDQASGFFEELLVMSVIENVYDEELNFYVDTAGTFRTTLRTQHFETSFTKSVSDFVCSSKVESFMVDFWEIQFRVSEMTGTMQEGRGPDTLITARNGQVLFPSMLESMEFTNRGFLRYCISPGNLLYDGQRFPYALAEEITDFGALLNAEKVVPSDFAGKATKMQKIKRSKSKWFCSKGDDFLSLYFVPDLDKDYKISPSYFIATPQRISPIDPCSTSCLGDMGSLHEEVAYCHTLAATISDADPRMIRVLQNISNKGRGYSMFIQAVFATLLIEWDMDSSNPTHVTVVLAQGESCLAHACLKAENIMRKVPGNGRAIIIQ